MIAARRKRRFGLAPRTTRQEASIDQPVDELDGALATQLQPLGQGPDRRRLAPLHDLDLEEEQVLLRFDSGGPSRLFPGPEEPMDVVAQVGPIIE